MNRPKKILIVVTSHDKIDATHPTGLWLEDFTIPYGEFKRANYEIALASPRGGATPIDPSSEPASGQRRVWTEAMRILMYSRRLEAMRADDYDALFFPGGHGAMFDLPGNPSLQRLIAEFANKGKVIGAVGHGSAALVNVRLSHGRSLVDGKTMTGFTDVEEGATSLAKLLPFLLESRLRQEGAAFVSGPEGTAHRETDGNLITGQNPESSQTTARAFVQTLERANEPQAIEQAVTE